MRQPFNSFCNGNDAQLLGKNAQMFRRNQTKKSSKKHPIPPKTPTHLPIPRKKIDNQKYKIFSREMTKRFTTNKKKRTKTDLIFPQWPNDKKKQTTASIVFFIHRITGAPEKKLKSNYKPQALGPPIKPSHPINENEMKMKI